MRVCVCLCVCVFCLCQPVEMSHPPLAGLQEPRESKGGGGTQPGQG